MNNGVPKIIAMTNGNKISVIKYITRVIGMHI